MKNYLLGVFIITLSIIQYVFASVGDKSKFFQNCVSKCASINCYERSFVNKGVQPIYEKLLLWTCPDECEYECMWITVDAFHSRGYNTPQFYGKWPFKRILGVQEPASVIFSLFNLYANIRGILWFRKTVRPDSPLYWLWHAYSMVAINAWIWSTIFHTRDFPTTEFFDYAFAFSIVLMNCYSMIIRFLRNTPRVFRIIITVFFIAFYVNHVTYLQIGKFDYSYNMQVNLIIGTFTGVGWFMWCVYFRERTPYVWKCLVFVACTGLSTLLEVIDMPPIYYMVDCHAMWHFVTAPLIYIFYSFIIDDCKYMRSQRYPEHQNDVSVEKIK